VPRRARSKLVRFPVKAPATWQEAAERFLAWKRAEGIAPRTLKDYQDHIRRFFEAHPDCWPERVGESALAYMGEEVSPAYFNLRLKYLKPFLSWCASQGWLPENPLAKLRYRRAEGRVVRLDAEVLQRLLALPDQRRFAGLRDFALLCLQLDTGIRPSEALALLPADVDLRSCEVHVRPEAAKTRVARVLPISAPTAQAIARLLAARHPSWGADVPVFCSEFGTRLTESAWARRLREYSARLGLVGVKVTPYMLRHAFALHYLRGGGDPFSLQRLLGHKHLEMTRRYLALTEADIREQHRRASPLMALLPKRARVGKVRESCDRPRRTGGSSLGCRE